MRFSLLEGLDHVAVVTAKRDLCDIDRAVADGFHCQVFSAVLLSSRGKLCNRTARRCLGRLAAGVRVNLGVENEHVDVLARAEHVIETAEADVKGPAVAAQDPHALANQRFGNRHQVACVDESMPASFAGEDLHSLPLRVDFGFGFLLRIDDISSKFGPIADARRVTSVSANAFC